MFEPVMLSVSKNQQKFLWLLLAAAVFTLDYLSKRWASSVLIYGEPVAFVPFFNFTLLHNYGAAFSLLSDAGGWQRWLFGVIAFVVSIFIVIWMWRSPVHQRTELAGLSFILGGALGNLWDRFVLGYVVDFIDWFYKAADGCLFFFYTRPGSQTCHWPAFNLADAAILSGAFLLFVDLLTRKENTA